jgi:hypothetical protein
MTKEKLKIASHPCEHKVHRIPIDENISKDHAKITDIKESYPIMKELKEYTGWIEFGYDPKNNSLDIHFKRSDFEWDYGAGIQINKLNKNDKEALVEYLKNGK